MTLHLLLIILLQLFESHIHHMNSPHTVLVWFSFLLHLSSLAQLYSLQLSI